MSSAEATASAFRSARILVVDDSAAARRQVRACLESHNFAIVEASEGTEALWRTRTEREKFDLILVDVHMPTMDGITFVRELRKLPEYSTTPVFVLTSDCSPVRIQEGRKAGATAWLVKPPKPEHLVQAIHKALSRTGNAELQIPANR